MVLPQQIVIVDDERSVRNGLSNLLHSEGYTTNQFESGEELIRDVMALTGTALLIVDIRLKGMSGFELYSILKKHSILLPVIFISAEQDDSVQNYAHSLGAVTFLRKPIDVDILLDIIRDELSQGKAY